MVVSWEVTFDKEAQNEVHIERGTENYGGRFDQCGILASEFKRQTKVTTTSPD